MGDRTTIISQPLQTAEPAGRGSWKLGIGLAPGTWTSFKRHSNTDNYKVCSWTKASRSHAFPSYLAILV